MTPRNRIDLQRQRIWRAQICRRSIRISYIFDTKAEADTWAAKVESTISRGVFFVDHLEAEHTTLADAPHLYRTRAAFTEEIAALD